MQMIPDNVDISLHAYMTWEGENPAARLCLSADRQSCEENFPFSIINDSGRLTRLVRASFVTDAGTILKRVFLLISRDNYFLRDVELWPVTNLDIEAAWQNAFSVHQNDGDRGLIILSGQLDGNGGLKPASSMFCCKKKHRYFQPPCPSCGNPLELCKEDAILLMSELHAYSRSLKRYLFCKTCASVGHAVFYANEYASDDPADLKYKWQLIDEFGGLLKAGKSPRAFPCSDCNDQDGCYGPDRAVHSRIVPFSFYPFYMLIFEEPSLNSMDFLALVSGASFTDLEKDLSERHETGRLECLRDIRQRELMGDFIFPAGDARHFLEVLYLKLSFLGDVMGQIRDGKEIPGRIDTIISTEKIWVGLPEQSGLLPSCWNFKTSILDLVNPPDMMGLFSEYTVSNQLFYLGLMWFQVLIVNKKQSCKEVFIALKKRGPGAGIINALFPENNEDFIYRPEQIFWNPDEENVGRDWLCIWGKSLDLGFSLLRAAFDHDVKWTYRDFRERFEKIRQEVKLTLIGGYKGKRDEVEDDDECLSDVEICRILGRINEKWREELTGESKSGTGSMSLDTMETLILSWEEGAGMVHPSPEEEITETIILSAGAAAVMLDSLSGFQPGEKDSDVAETIIISHGLELTAEKKAGAGETAMKFDLLREAGYVNSSEGVDELGETVILDCHKSGSKRGLS